jgi:hypothetical protein
LFENIVPLLSLRSRVFVAVRRARVGDRLS